ncbi:unnamed protein product [Moneuplotes crassus]|uniref:histidine kinase n=1 Tax=Euplotes crassus TaxID=5936 RepID=A0AAD2DAZ0_EUPCR|nr:unnamed protein product [Moneuplotes crassus]
MLKEKLKDTINFVWTDIILQNWLMKELQSRWVFDSIDFEDSKIEQMYQEHRLKTLRTNWKFILFVLKIKFLIISIVFQLNTEDCTHLKKLSPVMMFALMFVLKYFIRKSNFMARYGAILLIFWFGAVMTIVNLRFTQFRLYEGFLFHISVSFLLSTCLASDWKVSSVAILMVYSNLYAMLKVHYDQVPTSVLQVIIFSLTVFGFNAFLISRMFKQEFISTHQAKQASSQLKRVLQGLPEGVVIMDQTGEDLKLINKKLKQTFDISSFYQSSKEILKLQEIKNMVDESFDAIYTKTTTDSMSLEDPLKLKDNIFSNFVIRVNASKIEEGKGEDSDVQIEEYEDIPLTRFLQDERELTLHEEDNDRSTKVSISYNNKHMRKNVDFLNKDIVIKTSKIDMGGDHDKHHTFLQMFIDTTQITQLEEAKAQSNYQKQMLSNVSHEFRTPLNAMSLSLYLMKPHINEELAKYHQIATSSCDILKGLVEDILDFSKIEAGVFEIQESEFSFKELFDEVNSIFEMQTRMKGVHLNFNMEDVFQELKVKADKDRLKQIMLNLLSNSLKFTDNGSISVDLQIQQSKVFQMEATDWNEEIKMCSPETFEEMPVCNLLLMNNNYKFASNPSKFYGMAQDDSFQSDETERVISQELDKSKTSDFAKELKVELSVTDTGIGIPEKDLSSLFKLFGKTSSNHNRNKTGTGLGLTICKKLCEKLGGKIELTSKEAVGTKVTCSFTCLY